MLPTGLATGNEVFMAGLGDTGINYVSTFNISEPSAAWRVDYPFAYPVYDHGGATGDSILITVDTPLSIIYDGAKLNFLYDSSVVLSVTDYAILGRMQNKTFFLDVAWSVGGNISNLVFDSAGECGTLIFGSTGVPGTYAPVSSRVGDFYIDYATGVMYIRTV
jgi:hypothetical protein